MAAEQRVKYRQAPWGYLGHLEDKTDRQVTRKALRDEVLKGVGHPDFDPAEEMFPVVPAWVDADLV